MRWVVVLAVAILACHAEQNWDVQLSRAQAKRTAEEMKADPMRLADRIELDTVARLDVWCWCGLSILSRHRQCEVVAYGTPVTHLSRYTPLKVTSSRTGATFRCLDHIAIRNTIDTLLHSATQSFRESCRVMQQLVRDNYNSPFYHAVDVSFELRSWRCDPR